MEHRLSPRLALAVQVALYSRGALVVHGVCRNLGRDGMFVQVDPNLLSRNALVEVELLTQEHAGRLRLPAMVVHRTDEGVGLVFDEAAEPQAMRLVRSYVSSVRAAQTR